MAPAQSRHSVRIETSRKPKETGKASPVIKTIRRLPAQRRSREKVERIFAAVEHLLVTIGYDATTVSPTPLLDQAGVTKGVFYNYFASPEMAVEAVALSYIARSRASADRLADQAFRSWKEVLEAFFHASCTYYREPVIRELWLNGHLSPAAAVSADESTSYIANRLWETLVRVVGPDTPLEAFHCRVAMEILIRTSRFAFRHNPNGDERLLTESKIALTAYMGTHLLVG